MEGEIIGRRVYTRELKERTGYGETWIRTLEKRGTIPKGRVDPGGRRKWWTEGEAQQIVAGTAAQQAA